MGGFTSGEGLSLIWNDDIHPAEILRSLQCFFRLFLSDQDLRYPELRQRLALELNLRAQALKLESAAPDIYQKLQPLIQEFRHSESKVSSLEFQLLWEWNERYLQACSLLNLIELGTRVHAVDGRLQTSLSLRLKELQSEFSKNLLEHAPALSELCKTRWTQSPLRDELEYFHSLLSKAAA